MCLKPGAVLLYLSESCTKGYCSDKEIYKSEQILSCVDISLLIQEGFIKGPVFFNSRQSLVLSQSHRHEHDLLLAIWQQVLLHKMSHTFLLKVNFVNIEDQEYASICFEANRYGLKSKNIQRSVFVTCMLLLSTESLTEKFVNT